MLAIMPQKKERSAKRYIRLQTKEDDKDVPLQRNIVLLTKVGSDGVRHLNTIGVQIKVEKE